MLKAEQYLPSALCIGINKFEARNQKFIFTLNFTLSSTLPWM